MKQIFNVSAGARVIGCDRPAVPAGAPVRLPDDIADELAAGPDWSFENPRQPRERPASIKARKGAPEATKAEEKE